MYAYEKDGYTYGSFKRKALIYHTMSALFRFGVASDKLEHSSRIKPRQGKGGDIFYLSGQVFEFLDPLGVGMWLSGRKLINVCFNPVNKINNQTIGASTTASDGRWGFKDGRKASRKKLRRLVLYYDENVFYTIYRAEGNGWANEGEVAESRLGVSTISTLIFRTAYHKSVNIRY
ncbi:hypothetical protein P691DRAFT_780634 [Macrolepiota fuliginosa MF-IS2]|uniref:Uncharacterized protein n=1 Tax=Macrolepiota fuliginosa MF-IS2 TaxID=1400762 RepID=A0A9P5XC70_9AGAR|nr:hypothetical protein P691DRAFT_780634 [Macrolepiota fuliginosa MF-IS2]